MKLFLIATLVCSLTSLAHATDYSPYTWNRHIEGIKHLAQVRDKSEKCIESEALGLSQRYVLTKNAEGKTCALYDLSFPNLKALFTKKPVSELRLKKPSLSDYKLFLKNKPSEEDARRILSEEISSKELSQSWYSKLKFKNQNLRTNEDGLALAFNLSDVELPNRKLTFSKKEKDELKNLIEIYGVNARSVDFIENPRSIFDKIHLEYNSIKRIYEVFLDMNFLPLDGPIKLVNHDLQYSTWLEKQIRSLILNALNRVLRPVSATLPGKIALVVLNDAFEMIEMTYDFQRLQLDTALRMALSEEIPTRISKKDLKDSLYLLYVQDSQSLINAVIKLVQGHQVDLNNLYGFGKGAADKGHTTRVNLSDQNFSKLHYKWACDLKSLTYFFAHCEDQSAVHSLITETRIFLWSFGYPKIINLDSPWEVFLKRGAAYLLSSAVEVNFLNFPEWISSQVSGALKTYALSGILDEAFILSELYERKNNGMPLSSFEESAFKEILGKNIIPFLPKSEEGIKNTIEKNKSLISISKQEL